MASAEWIEIFRNWDGTKLRAHIAKLEEQIEVFTSQQVGQKSYVKDLGELRGQLSAAYRVLNQPPRISGDPNPDVAITDFSAL